MKVKEFDKLPKRIRTECFKRGIKPQDIFSVIQNVDAVVELAFGHSIIFKEKEN